jgi:hypothetical protein
VVNISHRTTPLMRPMEEQMTTREKIENAERLAYLNRREAEVCRASHSPRLASHHEHKAEQWAAIAADLRGEFR